MLLITSPLIVQPQTDGETARHWVAVYIHGVSMMVLPLAMFILIEVST